MLTVHSRRHCSTNRQHCMFVNELTLVLVADLVSFVDAYPFERRHGEDIDIAIRLGFSSIGSQTTPSISIQPKISRASVIMQYCNTMALVHSHGKRRLILSRCNNTASTHSPFRYVSSGLLGVPLIIGNIVDRDIFH